MTERELISRIRAILWREWDPIGVKAMGGPDDEYDSYAPSIAGAVLRGEPVATLAAMLLSIERDRMALNGDERNATRVAELLVALR